MAREVEILSTTTGSHYLLFGLSNDEISSFSVQLWLEKHGTRAVDWLQALSLGFVSFMGGNIYIHNSNHSSSNRCELFGEKKDCEVGVIINERPELKKILDSVGIHTDGEWEIQGIVIPADQNHPDGMYSTIPKSMFKKREGILYSEFMRNKKTSSSTIKAIEAITGEPLRGSTAYMILKNTADDKVQLWEVDINLTKSR